MERDVQCFDLANQYNNFNSHAHVERDLVEVTGLEPTANFNSHAHVERDSFAGTKRLHCVISTHTLTWSVTRSERPNR